MSDHEYGLQAGEYELLDNMWFKLRGVEKNNSDSGSWSFRLQFIESHMLLLIASGKGWITVDGRYLELRAGSAFVCTPGQLIEAFLEVPGERGLYVVRFDVFAQPETSERQTQNEPKLQNLRFPIEEEIVASSMIEWSALCEAIGDSMKSEDRLQRMRGQIQFYELLYSLLRDGQRVLDTDSEAAMERAKLYIEQHYREELTIELLAREAGISSRHFIRLFKQTYGWSAIEYLARYRIRQAQELMKPDSEYQLKDIASYVGYQDELYFRRKFKKITGTPPAAYMKNAKKRIVAYHANMIGHLLALHITPHAAPADHPWTEYYRRKYDTHSVLPLAQDDDVKIEQIRKSNPDYIVGLKEFTSAEAEKRLEELASTYLMPWLEHDWRMQLRLLAEWLNKSSEAEAWLDQYERKTRAVREQVKKVWGKERLLIARISGHAIHILGIRSLGEVFYDDLQIAPAAGIIPDQPEQQWTRDELMHTDADRLLLIVDDDAKAQAAWQELRQSEAWGQLKAVRNRRIDYLPSYPWTEYTAFTQDLVLDEVLKLWRNRA
ncbi:ABC-type Fe3+-hydroxamate transport system, substrate-binding protein [Paenibacillus algorifonticola]|uniref:ABC-type Fe3+-hydroxamate transport system, substrate-binding protein n=1 Tax=Paenibacillus algorifonticola TaxID=684063 RepID=A0A1I2HQX1_9BACL|nr:helix-turn-helix domain-containing protein [Paenibacillus algorifonticola]SFF31710.1 ABC-type Fe3+-hydroxamate transport system, substrate-binding protein [Paenibacillus algorifonticola]